MEELTLAIFFSLIFFGKMCVFVSRLRKNGDLPKRIVDFLREKDTFRNKIMEIVEDFDEKSYNNNSKHWKSARICRVKPNFFIFHHCSSFFFILLFLIFSFFRFLFHCFRVFLFFVFFLNYVFFHFFTFFSFFLFFIRFSIFVSFFIMFYHFHHFRHFFNIFLHFS